LSPVAGKPIVVRFDGGLLSSDGGLLALREIEQRLGIAARVAGCITDPRVPEQVTHQLDEIVRFRMLMIAAYEDGNDADARIASPEMLPWADPLPHLICSPPSIIGGGGDGVDQQMRVRLYDDRLECFLGGTLVQTLRRGRSIDGNRRGHVVDYRHIIHALRRKPMALLNLVYREQLFPREAHRHAWDALTARPARNACRSMVDLLALAHDRACEAELASELEASAATGQLPDLAELRRPFMPSSMAVPIVTVTLPAAVAYDALLSAPQEWLRS
jgi:hypothetical protein